MKTLDMVVTIDDFDGLYTWGVGDKGSFLHKPELSFRGTAWGSGSDKQFPALVDIDTFNGAEPESVESDSDVVAVGKLEIKTTVQIYIVVPHSGISYMMQLLNSGKDMELCLSHGPLEEDGLGGQKAELLRLTMSSRGF